MLLYSDSNDTFHLFQSSARSLDSWIYQYSSGLTVETPSRLWEVPMGRCACHQRTVMATMIILWSLTQRDAYPNTYSMKGHSDAAEIQCRLNTAEFLACALNASIFLSQGPEQQSWQMSFAKRIFGENRGFQVCDDKFCQQTGRCVTTAQRRDT